MLRVNNNPPVDYSKCNQTVTIYHNDHGTITTRIIPRAFFDFRKVQNVDRTGSKEANGFLLVIPGFVSDEQPVFVGDKVLLGVGPEVATTALWAQMIPSTTPNMAVVSYVDPKYWKAKIAHWEAGG